MAPGQNIYREISSCSNFGDFQARRAKSGTGRGRQNRLRAHLERLGPRGRPHGDAVMENYQLADGTIAVPEVLRPICTA